MGITHANGATTVSQISKLLGMAGLFATRHCDYVPYAKSFAT